MSVPELPYAHGGPPWTGVLKASADDFVVDEVLGFAPSGAGEHAFLHVEKRGANSEWVARALASAAGVPAMAVGFAGLKDRHAVTRQFYTVQLGKRADPDWLALAHPEFRVLAATRHDRKLKRGALRGNRFLLVLRDVGGDVAAGTALAARIAERGVPNYFGEQRFGREGGNVERALQMFRGERLGRAERGIVLSAARSAVFNAVLADRVRTGTWDTAIPGDVFQIDGSGSIFGPEPVDDALAARIAAGRVHPTAPLWGRGPLRTADAALAVERAAGEAHAEVCAGLEAAGLEQERRATRLVPRDFELSVDAGVARLAFSLPAGAYATVVVRELCRTGIDPSA